MHLFQISPSKTKRWYLTPSKYFNACCQNIIKELSPNKLRKAKLEALFEKRVSACNEWRQASSVFDNLGVSACCSLPHRSHESHQSLSRPLPPKAFCVVFYCSIHSPEGCHSPGPYPLNPCPFPSTSVLLIQPACVKAFCSTAELIMCPKAFPQIIYVSFTVTCAKKTE